MLWQYCSRGFAIVDKGYFPFCVQMTQQQVIKEYERIVCRVAFLKNKDAKVWKKGGGFGYGGNVFGETNSMPIVLVFSATCMCDL